MSVSRNEPCTCGSGRKYKHCCAGKTPIHKQSRVRGALVAVLVVIGLVIGGLALSNSSSEDGLTPQPGPAPPGKVWSAEHGHWHDAW
ncbi:hypothetical protein BH23BAC4_BH23BAC4_11510 [soil metagenome]